MIGKTKEYDVHPIEGAYVVTETEHFRAFVVDKAKNCSCGGSANKQCRHINAVSKYLRRGGERAPEKRTDTLLSSSPAVCPICGAVVQGNVSFWRCSQDSSHYWQWRGERSGVKDFLTKPHPAKQGAFYEQSPSERMAFLAAHQYRPEAVAMTV